jgi:membrane protease YdiL (CAAX protease family)
VVPIGEYVYEQMRTRLAGNNGHMGEHHMYAAPPPPPQQQRQWIVRAAPGTRYDRLASTPAHRWWRPALGTLLVAGGYLLVSVVVLFGGFLIALMAGVPLLESDGETFADPLLGLIVSLLAIALGLPIVFGVVWLVQRRPPGTLSSVAGHLRWGWLMMCVLVALLAGVLGQAAAAVTYAVTGAEVTDVFGWAGWDTFLPGLIVTVLLVPFQAASEEYAFRGWLLQAFGAYLRTPWPGILLGAAGFTALHGYSDWGILDVFAFGTLMGWMAVRTGGLEAPIALHVVNNVLGFGISSAAGTLDDALQQGAVAWQSLAGTVVQLGVFGVVVLFLARRNGIGVTSPGPSGPSGPSPYPGLPVNI